MAAEKRENNPGTFVRNVTPSAPETELQKQFVQRDRAKAYIRKPYPSPALEADPDAEGVYNRFVESARAMTTPGLTNADDRMTNAAKFLSGSDPGLIERAAADVGVSAEDLMAEVERFEPGSVRKFGLQKKGISTSSEGDRPWKNDAQGTRGPTGVPSSQFGDKGRSVKGKAKTEIDWDSKPRPTVEDALGVMTESGGIALGPGMRDRINNLRKTQSQYATGENIAREAARNRPLGSFTKAEQYLEDLESVNDLPFERQTRGAPLAYGQEGPAEMPIPRATYAGKGTGRPLGPGGRGEGTQEDFRAYRTQKSIDDAVAERQRQKRIEFLRAGGRMTADGKSIAVLPGRGPEKRSGDYQYADELREEARLAENKRNKESLNRFRDNSGQPATEFGREIAKRDQRNEEAQQYLRTVKQQIRGAEQTARDLARGYSQVHSNRRDRVTYGGDAGEFFDEVDDLRSIKAQLAGKDINAQMAWARQKLNDRDAVVKEMARQEEGRRRRVEQVANNSYMGLVDMARGSKANLYSGSWE